MAGPSGPLARKATNMQLPSLVLGLLLLVGSQAQTQTQTSVSFTGDDISTKPMRTVCVSPYTALDNCGTDGTTDFTGYEPQLFKAVASWLYDDGVGSRPEWGPGKWSFSCFVDSTTGYYDVIAALNNGTCDVAMGGITQDEVQNQPVALTYSTYQAGRRIIIYRANPQSRWVFLQPFSTGVWLLMFASSVVVALVLLAMETPWVPICRNMDGEDQSQGHDQSWQQVLLKYWRRYSNLQWSVTGLMLHGVFQLSPRSPGGRVVVLGTAFTSLLLACMYTSSYAALITTKNLKAQVTAMSDLTTLPVGIWEGDDSAFKVFPLQNVKLLPWNNHDDEQNMMQLLRQGTIAALVIDAPFADYQTSINCDLYEVGELVLPINMGFGVAKALSATYAIYLDGALQALQAQGILQQLQVANVRIPSSCPNKQSSGTAYTQIVLHDVGGLWIILASCIGLGILWNLLSWLLPNALALLGLGGLSSYRLNDPAVMDVLDPAWREGQSPGATEAHPATIDEALLGVDRRLDKIECFIDQIPRLLSKAMDQRLTSLQVELAVVIRHQLIGRGLSHPGGGRDSGGGVGTGHLNNSTPKTDSGKGREGPL